MYVSHYVEFEFEFRLCPLCAVLTSQRLKRLNWIFTVVQLMRSIWIEACDGNFLNSQQSVFFFFTQNILSTGLKGVGVRIFNLLGEFLYEKISNMNFRWRGKTDNPNYIAWLSPISNQIKKMCTATYEVTFSTRKRSIPPFFLFLFLFWFISIFSESLKSIRLC